MIHRRSRSSTTTRCPDGPLEPEDSCEDGDHDWKFLGENREGDRFYKCRRCGEGAGG